MSKHLRKKRFVDSKVQGTLVKNIVRYWAVSIAAAGGLTVIGWIFITPGLSGFIGPNAFMASIIPMVLVGLAAAVLVLPVLLLDVIRVSHRFAGPLVRFKRHLTEAAEGGPLRPLHFRDEDFWPEIAEAYNALVDRIEQERATYQSAINGSDELTSEPITSKPVKSAEPLEAKAQGTPADDQVLVGV